MTHEAHIGSYRERAESGAKRKGVVILRARLTTRYRWRLSQPVPELCPKRVAPDQASTAAQTGLPAARAQRAQARVTIPKLASIGTERRCFAVVSARLRTPVEAPTRFALRLA